MPRERRVVSATRMGPDGSLTLPEPQARFFGEGEPIEVVQYRWHLGLWREWRRARPRRVVDRASKDLAASQCGDAANRLRARAGDLFQPPVSDAATALYLYGLAVELRLKELLCRAHSAHTLARAQYEAEKLHGEPLDIMGGVGHDLELLLNLSLRRRLLREAQFREAWTRVAQWGVDWRYRTPEHVLAGRQRYWAAFEQVWQRLEEEG